MKLRRFFFTMLFAAFWVIVSSFLMIGGYLGRTYSPTLEIVSCAVIWGGALLILGLREVGK